MFQVYVVVCQAAYARYPHHHSLNIGRRMAMFESLSVLDDASVVDYDIGRLCPVHCGCSWELFHNDDFPANVESIEEHDWRAYIHSHLYAHVCEYRTLFPMVYRCCQHEPVNPNCPHVRCFSLQIFHLVETEIRRLLIKRMNNNMWLVHADCRCDE